MRELLFSVTLADCDVQTFSVSGGGGQRRDKKSTGVRIVHKASGAVGTGTEERSQLQNKKAAFKRVIESKTFKAWLKMQTSKDDALKAQVDQETYPNNIKVEVMVDGEWVEQ